MPKQQVQVRKISTDFNTYLLNHTKINEKEDAELVLNDNSYIVPGPVAKCFINMVEEIDTYYQLFKNMEKATGDYGES